MTQATRTKYEFRLVGEAPSWINFSLVGTRKSRKIHRQACLTLMPYMDTPTRQRPRRGAPAGPGNEPVETVLEPSHFVVPAGATACCLLATATELSTEYFIANVVPGTPERPGARLVQLKFSPDKRGACLVHVTRYPANGHAAYRRQPQTGELMLV